MKLPKDFIDINFAFSRVAGPAEAATCRTGSASAAPTSRGCSPTTNCYVYVCGLKGMEEGVDEAFRDACRAHGIDWDALLPELRAPGRYHVETY